MISAIKQLINQKNIRRKATNNIIFKYNSVIIYSNKLVPCDVIIYNNNDMKIKRQGQLSSQQVRKLEEDECEYIQQEYKEWKKNGSTIDDYPEGTIIIASEKITDSIVTTTWCENNMKKTEKIQNNCHMILINGNKKISDVLLTKSEISSIRKELLQDHLDLEKAIKKSNSLYKNSFFSKKY